MFNLKIDNENIMLEKKRMLHIYILEKEKIEMRHIFY